jgi:polyhydroxybutyrate depolymerase
VLIRAHAACVIPGMLSSRSIVLALLWLGAIACSSETDTVARAIVARGTGAGDWAAGDYPSDLRGATYLQLRGIAGQNDMLREYKVHVPPSYLANTPMPLVFCIHGLGQQPETLCLTGTAMDQLANQAGFILVLPRGFSTSWNGGACCGPARDARLDDVAFFRAMLAEVGKHLNVDLDRVYATGLSNGAYMSYRLACEAADLFAGVLPAAGALGLNEFVDDAVNGTGLFSASSNFDRCAPSHPISILATHGTSDFVVPIALQAKSLAKTAAALGCNVTTKPASVPKSAGDTTCTTYEGCPGDIEVTGCAVAQGGHCWFGSPDCGIGLGASGAQAAGNNSNTLDTSAALLEFIRGHHK